jgi:hypothetical protein
VVLIVPLGFHREAARRSWRADVTIYALLMVVQANCIDPHAIAKTKRDGSG